MKKILSNYQKLICIVFIMGAALMILGSFLYVHSEWNVFTVDGSENFYRKLFIEIGLARNAADDYPELGYVFTPLFDTDSFSYVFSTKESAIDFYTGLWSNIQRCNNLLFYTGLVSFAGIAICAVLGQFGNRKYYLSNLIGGVATGAVGIILSIWTMLTDIMVMSDISKVGPDIENLNIAAKAYAEANKQPYAIYSVSPSQGTFAIIISVIFIVICALFIFGTIYKYNQSRKQIRMEACLDE